MDVEKPINYTREAFLHPVNIGVLFVSTLSAFFLNDSGAVASLILSMTFGMELVYLGVVPRLPRFKKMTRLRKMKERNSAMEEKTVFQELDRKSQKRFLVLKHLTKLIKENFDKLPYSSQGLLDNIRNKIEELLSNYITLLDLHRRYEVYMNSSMEEALRREIAKEEENLKTITSERLKQTKTRRLAILKKRLKKFESAKEKNMICETHLETIEDAVRYIYEQSMTMSDPEEVGFQLDNLLNEVEETSQLIHDLDQDIFPVYTEGEAVPEMQLDEEAPEVSAEETEPPQTAKRVKEQ